MSTDTIKQSYGYEFGRKVHNNQNKTCCFNTQAEINDFNPDSCAKGLLIYDLRSTNMWRKIV